MSGLNFLPPPMRECLREPAGTLWCFKCRKHLPHDHVYSAPITPSYYSMTWIRECSRCHEDHTLFPGYSYWPV